MKVYLDNCVLQRPLDNKNQIRIALEAEAMLGIISMCEAGKISFISSDILVFEISKIPNLTRKEYSEEMLLLASDYIELNDEIEKRAKYFCEFGIKDLDALHLASAEIGKVDFFCTCDDSFFKKAKQIKDIKVKIKTPLELIQEISI
jgi:predicted nucleic acid-binding protein